MYIKNCRNSSNINHLSPIELSRRFENECFEIDNFSYIHRQLQVEKNENTNGDKKNNWNN
jgi:hypothetical protein